MKNFLILVSSIILFISWTAPVKKTYRKLHAPAWMNPYGMPKRDKGFVVPIPPQWKVQRQYKTYKSSPTFDPVVKRVPVDSTGATDVTVALNQWFEDSVPNNSRVVFASNGLYQMDGILHLMNRDSIELDLNGSRIYATTNGEFAPLPNDLDLEFLWPRKRSQIRLTNGSYIKIRNGQIDGHDTAAAMSEGAYNANYEAQHNIDAEGVDSLEINNMTLTKPWGDFIYVGRWSDGDGSQSNKVWIHNDSMVHNGRQGVSLVGANRVVVEDCTMDSTRRASFDLEPDDAGTGCNYIRIQDNRIGPGVLLFVASGGQAATIDSVFIERNTLTSRAMNIRTEPYPGSYRTNWRIAYNTSNLNTFNSPEPMIDIKACVGLEVIGNVSPITNTTVAVGLTDVCNYRVDSNTFLTPDYYVGTVNSYRTCDSVDTAPLLINAGSDQSITASSTSVTGTASDANAPITSVGWQQISGPAVVSFGTNTAYTTTVSGMTVTGTYSIRFLAQSIYEQYIDSIVHTSLKYDTLNIVVGGIGNRTIRMKYKVRSRV